MVAAVRAGFSQRRVAREHGVGLATVQLWLTRAGDRRLDRVDWSDRPSAPRRPTRTEPELEERILALRRELREESALGEYGAAAIRRALLDQPHLAGRVPAERTIARILERRGALDARRRVRRPPPPRGWYLPELRAGRVELDSFDVVEGLRLKGGRQVEVLTAISLHGGLPAAWPASDTRTRMILTALQQHWRRFGLPRYAQFDNDARFIGGHRYPDSIGGVIRLCLALAVVPVFAPPRETGFQAAVEALNGRWQAKVWARRGWDGSLLGLQQRSAGYIAACHQRAAPRIEAAPPRAAFPEHELDLRAAPSGRLIFLRRTSDAGTVSVLNRRYLVDDHWPHRLVRAELDLDARRLRFFALRRREPTDQPLLSELAYEPPPRWYR
ncbi:MAG: hypothetical protein ACR2K4_02670 [Candidatus Limnocylindria bacterium]